MCACGCGCGRDGMMDSLLGMGWDERRARTNKKRRTEIRREKLFEVRRICPHLQMKYKCDVKANRKQAVEKDERTGSGLACPSDSGVLLYHYSIYIHRLCSLRLHLHLHPHYPHIHIHAVQVVPSTWPHDVTPARPNRIGGSGRRACILFIGT